MNQDQYLKLHQYVRTHRITPWLRGIVRPLAVAMLRVIFGFKLHSEMIPPGPVIIASNHRSMLDPFLIGVHVPGPVYFPAKHPLFRNRLTCWFFSRMGCFPVMRGSGDREPLETMRAVIERGEPVIIFPESTRGNGKSLGELKPGVGWLALATGVPVVTVAVFGTDTAGNGWWKLRNRVRLRFDGQCKVRKVEQPTAEQARQATELIGRDMRSMLFEISQGG